MDGNQKIPVYHITHLDNIESILLDGCLFCDSFIKARPKSTLTNIGNEEIKNNRLTLKVKNHSSLQVGDCVPFYFCYRSVMLYIIHRGHDPKVKYHRGQEEVLHLEFDLHKLVDYANSLGNHWAFTTSNAGSAYTEFYRDLADLNKIHWEAVHARDFRDSAIKYGKASEFLIEKSVPFEFVVKIGVKSIAVKNKVDLALSKTSHQPLVNVEPTWYY
jgi:ssDNA thymidine ADP-ribosyltransferase, DarT